ncbi:MAG TPA: nuclear transport factor 2 family protein, partial [Pyrinomonadaceae bacterium]|nr:nuclear transport factor 2 family protein [Pyrinomonadaceae bacterium]
MKILITLLLMLGSCLLALGQKASDAQSLVDAERAFARTSVEKGTRPAFMEFIADDGILFRPGAVKGKQWMIDHPAPAPAPNKRPVLNWGPTFALVSRAGDLGYDFGPWEAKGDINDEKPGAFGHFITVWKRQADGNWKFVVDLGISHPGPHPGPPEW